MKKAKKIFIGNYKGGVGKTTSAYFIGKNISELEVFEAAEIKACIKAVQKETGVKGKNLFMPIRVAVSGQMHGPELAETIMLLGKEKVLDHIKQATN